MNKAQQELKRIEEELEELTKNINEEDYEMALSDDSIYYDKVRLEAKKEGILLGLEANNEEIGELKKEIEMLKEQLQAETDYAKDQQKIFQKEYYPPEKAYKEGYDDARNKFG